MEICINAILQETDDFSFNVGSISSQDGATLYYTAGAFARSLLKWTKCVGCKDLVSAGKEELTIDTIDTTEFDTLPEEQKYIVLANRGGLMKPSNLLYVICEHAWSLYSFITGRKSTYHVLFACTYPRSTFVSVFLELLKRDDNTSILLTHECKNGCKFEEKVKLIAIATFNIKAKNFVSEANDKIHSSTSSHSDSNHKKFNGAQKLKKLKSN